MESLTRQLGLDAAEYWISIGGGAPVPLAGAELPDGQYPIYLLKRVDGELVDGRWTEVSIGEAAQPRQPAGHNRILIDRSPPKARFEIHGPRHQQDGLQVISPASRVSLTFSDVTGVSSWRVTDSHPESSVNGQWLPGRHRLEVSATDTAGNAGPAGQLDFLVDGQGPEILIRLLDPVEGDPPVFQSPVTVEITARDASGLARLEASSGDGWQPVSSGDQLQVSTESITVRAEDALGNATEGNLDWQYDLDGPLIQLSLETGEDVTDLSSITLEQNQRINIQLSDTGAGVDRAEYRYNNGPYVRLPRAIRFRDLGHYRLHIRAWDRFGNWSSRYWSVNTVRPGTGGGRP